MAIRSERLRIIGMRCVGCETAIEEALQVLPGVRSAKANHTGGCVDVRFDDAVNRLSQILAIIEEAGYGVTLGGAPAAPVRPPMWVWLGQGLKMLILFLAIGSVVYWGMSLMPGVMMQMHDPSVGYAMILLAGFLTGFHCIGMCGSFVVAYSTAAAGRGKGAQVLAHLAYGAGKTLSYAAIGAIFGAVGALMTITPYLRGIVAVAAGLFLVLYGLRMLNLFTGQSWLGWVFPKAVMHGVQTGIRHQPRPLVIGLLSGFLLGCGPLQAMYIMAAGTGSPREGALLLMFFSLGTLGPLLTLGVFAHLLSRRMMNELLRASGVLVLIMGLLMINRGLRLTESGFDTDSLRKNWEVLMHSVGMHAGHHEH